MQKETHCCAHCGESNIKFTCGNNCGTVYCSEECGIENWTTEHEINCDLIEKRSGEKTRPVSREKAREILHHHSVYGHPLTSKQQRFFGYWSNN